MYTLVYSAKIKSTAKQIHEFYNCKAAFSIGRNQ